MNEVLVAIITGIASVAGVVITTAAAHRHTDAQLAQQQAITAARLDELTREVRKHNQFAERMPRVECEIENLSRRVEACEAGRRG